MMASSKVLFVTTVHGTDITLVGADRSFLPITRFSIERTAPPGHVVGTVARLAAQRGMRVVSQSFDEGRAQQGDGALYLNLGLTGNYPSLRLLLADFSGLPVWLEVVEAHIERVGDGGRLVRAQLRLLTYRTDRVAGQ